MKHFFSTGILRVGAAGAGPLGAADVVGELQGVSFDATFQKKEMRTSTNISNFPVDVAHYDGNCALKCEVGDFKPALLPILAGAVRTPGSPAGYDTYTLKGTSKPDFFRIEFEGVDTNGKKMLIVLFRAKAPGFTAAFKRDDYAVPQFEATGYPSDFNDPGSDVCAIQFQN